MSAAENAWGLFGHEWAVQLLLKHFETGGLRHAYLFTGPQGVGRRSLARRLTQAIYCQQPPAAGVPCLKCRACQQTQALQHPDLMQIQAETEGGVLKVEQVREVQKFLSLKPYQASHKIIWFLRFHEANLNAQNALLKTLEEAPSYAILLLTADSAEQLLPTIVSRCEVIRLRPAAPQELQTWLQTQAIPAKKAELLAHLSAGRAGYALRLAADEKALAFRAEKVADFSRLLNSNVRERFTYAEKLAKDREVFRQTLELWLTCWRDTLLLCAGAAPDGLTNVDAADFLQETASHLSLAQARQQTAGLQTALERLGKNSNPRLLAEVTLMDFPRLKVPAWEPAA